MFKLYQKVIFVHDWRGQDECEHCEIEARTYHWTEKNCDEVIDALILTGGAGCETKELHRIIW